MIDHKILWFYVSADDTFFWEILEDEDDGGCVKLAIFGGEEADGFEYIVEIFAFDVFMEVVDVVGTLEFLAHWNYEWTGNDIEGFTLIDCEFEHIMVLNFLFVYTFKDEVMFAVRGEVEWSELTLSFESGDDL